ncbi:hypothetical protein [Nocardioides flavescens]|uniref:PH domain-containing protein n=1 Tax=Nocardioides flavescens TaxID=2691959 RepID=A0A6L7ESJ2_9ACTN|nr:hypothetical protein [Nocardioides flavescens]MXG90407.1 hypothetical protein [Nocardioides flavescens]
MTTTGSALDVRLSTRSQLLLLGLVVTIGLVSNLGLLFGGQIRPLGAAFLSLAAAALAFAFVEIGREHRREPVLIIGSQGVTVRGQRTVAWDEVAEVRVTGAKPRWALAGGRRSPMVAFVARGGQRLPSISQAQRPRLPWARPLLRRYYDADLVIPIRFVEPTLDEVLTAVRRFSDVPVTDVR